MRTLIRCAVLACATFFSCNTLFAQSANDHLRHDLDSLFSDTTFSNATFGVAIQSLKTGEYLYRKNDTKSLLPASNMKLFTTAEALALLGPEYRYKTKLLTNGRIKGNVLYGDLIYCGAGDPTLGNTRWLTFLPVSRVQGGIFADESYFTSELYPFGWGTDDLPYYYAAPVTALSWKENKVAVAIVPNDSVARRPQARFAGTETEYGILVNRATTGVDSSRSTLDVARDITSDSIFVTGSIPHLSKPDTQMVSVRDPKTFFELVSRLALYQTFHQILGTARLRRISRQTEIDSTLSEPLSKIVRHMNKESDNFYAECLFRTVAKEIGGEGSWTRGIEVMRKYLATIGIDTAHIQFTDGSGLSRMDLVTADDIVKVLLAMHENPKLWESFYNSLPIAGVDGTLESQMKGTPAQGNVHAKTGSMTGVRAVSGYLTTRDGEMLAFSILANNYTVPGSEIGKLEDEVLLRLVNFSRQ